MLFSFASLLIVGAVRVTATTDTNLIKFDKPNVESKFSLSCKLKKSTSTLIFHAEIEFSAKERGVKLEIRQKEKVAQRADEKTHQLFWCSHYFFSIRLLNLPVGKSVSQSVR